MTPLDGIQPAFSAPAATGVQTATNGTTLSSDFETFLKMLTVQMQNQDPLNPVDSSEFAVQLATFSSVEQQVLTNDLLQQLVGQAGGSLAQMANWVGMEVRRPGAAEFEGAPISVWVDPEPGADSAVLIARDSTGREVQRQPIVAATGEVSWQGQADTGQGFLYGAYTFEVESFSGNQSLSVRPAQTYAEIVEAQTTPSGLVLVTQGGQTMLTSEATGLRLP